MPINAMPSEQITCQEIWAVIRTVTYVSNVL